MWYFKRKRADQALKELVESLSKVLGSKLTSLMVYGSKASGEFREGNSDVNLFIVLEDVAAETLELMSPSVRAWVRAGHPMPVFVQKDELTTYAQSLPIEFLDMQDHHKVVHGSDPLEGLVVSRLNLRAQCLQELSVKQLKLRQALLVAGSNPRRIREVLLRSLPSILTLYRAMLRLEAEVPKGSKIVAAKELAQRVGFDGDCLERLWNNHIRREADNMQGMAFEYLEGVERALAYLAKK